MGFGIEQVFRRQPRGPRAPRRFCIVALALAVAVLGCTPQQERGPFRLLEEDVWKVVNRNHRGDDGIYVQALWRTLAFEIASAYAETEDRGFGQEQVTGRLREFVYTFIDGRYPVEDGTDVNNLYLQYLIYIDSEFDPTNSIEKAQFDAWRGQYVRRLMGRIADLKYPLLRNHYDERWGWTLYSRLVFTIYMDNSESDVRPRVADIGDRTFLVDEEGQRYAPSGNAGPYPFDFDRPEDEHLDGHLVYRLFFPNRKADRKTPILDAKSKYFDIIIEGLGEVPVRRMRWNLPLVYPEAPGHRLGPRERPSLVAGGDGG